jgi:hypothetical protein
MKARYLLLSSLVGGLVSFGWGFVSHGTGLFKSLEPNTFKEPDVLTAIQQNAPVNGIYMDDRGVFAAVDLERGPNPSPKFDSIVVPMLTQLGVEILVAFLLAWLLLRLPPWSAFGTGAMFATVAVAAGIAQLMPESIWFFFPAKYQLANLADLVIGWFLLGVVLATFRKKIMLGEPTA